MIHLLGSVTPTLARLLTGLRARGHEVAEDAAPEPGSGATLLLSAPVHWMSLGVGFARWRVARGARVLVISRMGAHPDAVAEGLRELWRLEEYARVSLMPALALRLAPLVGDDTPFWRRLRARPRLGAAAGRLVMPVLESDVIDLLDAALRERGAWEGWFDVAGPEALSLQEWSDLASAARSGPESDEAWEPPLEEIAEHRLAESELWQTRFGLRARPVSAWASGGPA